MENGQISNEYTSTKSEWMIFELNTGLSWIRSLVDDLGTGRLTWSGVSGGRSTLKPAEISGGSCQGLASRKDQMVIDYFEPLPYPSSREVGKPKLMDRQGLLKRLDEAWAAMKESYAGLSDSQLTEPGVTGDWSVKDILAHVTTWEEEAIKVLPLIVEGGRLPRYSQRYGGIDAFNAQMTEQKRGLSLSDVLRQLDETHRRLIDYVNSVSEEQFRRETRFRRRLRLDTYSHYPEHTRAIREWRERSSG